MGFERYAIARSVFRRVSRGAPCGGDLLGLWPPEVGVRLQRPFDSYDALCHYLDQHSGELASTFIGPDTGIREHINLGDLHCGGNPCTDWSFMGQRRGLTGPTTPVLVTWGLLIRRHAPPFVIQENVEPFPTQLLLDLLGPDYSVEILHVDPRQRGWPVARRRKYAVFTHRRAQLQVELSVLAPLLDATVPRGSALTFAVAPQELRPLSVCEQQWLSGYSTLWSRTPREVWDVSQNPVKRPRGALVDGCLCTLTCSSSRLYMPRFKRCFTGDELLLAQAFPSTQWALTALGLPGPMRLLPKDLSNHAAVRLAGNAMHGSCMGLIMGWVVLYGLWAPRFSDAVPSPPSEPRRVHSTPARVIMPEPTLHWRLSEYTEALTAFLARSRTPVARSFRATPLDTHGGRRRDLFPLPDLPAVLEGDPPPILRTQARLLICGLNVLWGGGAVTPCCEGTGTRAQRRVHQHILRHGTEWLLRMGRSDCSHTSAMCAWRSFEDTVAASPVPLTANLVDLPVTAATCDPTALLGPELRNILADARQICPDARVGHEVHGPPPARFRGVCATHIARARSWQDRSSR